MNAIWQALAREAGLAAEHLGIGVTAIGKASYAQHARYAQAWLHQFRRLRIRYERRPSIHEAFLKLGCALICRRFLRATSFCYAL